MKDGKMIRQALLRNSDHSEGMKMYVWGSNMQLPPQCGSGVGF